MTIDFAALQAAVDKAKTESDEATAAGEALAAVNMKLGEVQAELNEAIETSTKESDERASSLQAIIDIVSAGL